MRRHPDELSQKERLLRVRGVGEKTIDQLARGGYMTVEDLAREADMMKLGETTELGVKKAKQIKHAAEQYVQDEAKLRTELNAERERQAAASLLEPRAPAEAPSGEAKA
jgi:N utilization substance protein A